VLILTSSASFNVKIVLVGDGGVGKTAIRRRFMGQGFKSTYMGTIGSDFSTKTINIEHELNFVSINFQIWDLAGHPKFSNVRKLFYAGAQGLIFVFDLTRLDSLENVNIWIDEVISNGITKVPALLIGNKSDLQDEGIPLCPPEAEINFAELMYEKLNQRQKPVQRIRTSAKSGENIEKAFELLAKDIYVSIKG
jgi:small GTP-binding protein